MFRWLCRAKALLSVTAPTLSKPHMRTTRRKPARLPLRRGEGPKRRMQNTADWGTVLRWRRLCLLRARGSQPTSCDGRAVPVRGQAHADRGLFQRRLGAHSGGCDGKRLRAERRIGPHGRSARRDGEGPSGDAVGAVGAAGFGHAGHGRAGADVQAAEGLRLPAVRGERFSLLADPIVVALAVGPHLG